MRTRLLAILIALGTVQSLAQVNDATVQDLLRRYQSDPSNSLLCEQIGIAYTRLNTLDKAADFFRRAVDLDPQRISSQKNLGTVLWFLGRKSESASLFTTLEKRIPTDPVPQLYLGLHAYDEKNMEAAAAHFERAGSLASDNPETFPVLVDAYLASGRFTQASELLEHRISEGNGDAKTYRALGDAYDKLAQPEKAYQAYSSAIGRAQEEEENYLALAAFCIEHANPKFARQVLARGLKAVPRSAKLRLEQGLSWAIEGDFENAKTSFAEANASDSRWSMPLLALGVTDLQTGHPDEAADSFRKAKSLAPDDYRCYYLQAVALTRSHASQEAATRAMIIEELRRAIALAPEQVQPRVALAKAEIADGKPDVAESQLREAIRTTPWDPDALYNLALLCRREGKTEEAAGLLRTFRQLKNKSQDEENQFVLILKTVDKADR